MKAKLIVLILIVVTAACTGLDVAERPEDVEPLDVGEAVPDVTLRNAFDHKTELRNLVSEKPTLIIFYRGGWCPYCNTHLSGIAEIEDEIYEMGIQIVGISPDKPSYLKESTMEHELGYQLLSDSDMMAAKRFGLAFKVDSETINRYKQNGLDLAERSGHDHYLLPVPAAFLVDRYGIIKYRYFNPDYKVRIENEELLRVTKELISEKHS